MHHIYYLSWIKLIWHRHTHAHTHMRPVTNQILRTRSICSVFACCYVASPGSKVSTGGQRMLCSDRTDGWSKSSFGLICSFSPVVAHSVQAFVWQTSVLSSPWVYFTLPLSMVFWHSFRFYDSIIAFLFCDEIVLTCSYLPTKTYVVMWISLG